MGLFSFLKKKEKEVVAPAPDLMAADPAAGDSVNLMAADPINSAPIVPNVEPAPTIVEAPGIEAQLTAEPKPQSETPLMVQKEEVPVQTAPDMNAFEMPMPAVASSSEPVVAPGLDAALTAAPEVPSAPASQAPSANNKFCADCGTPNDPLSKFCVSCGKAIE